MLKKATTGVLLLICIVFTHVRAQESLNPVVVDYVRTYADYAIREMQRTGVPAAIKLAQGILETEAGKSDLVIRSNNHFGIKCKSWWTGEKVYHDDDLKGECFRKYADAYDSWKDHSDYLRSQPRYASLFELDPEDYAGWAKGLKKAGYATNPKYPQILIRYIETYRLDEYTMIALGRKKADTNWIALQVPADKTAQENNARSKNRSAQMIEEKPVQQNSNIVAVTTAVTYPDGEFKINDTRVIYAAEGTSLLAVAEKYNVKLKWIYDFNELDKSEEVLSKGQLIYLQRKRKQGHNEFHVIRENETLKDISQEEGLRLESLLAYNHLEKNMSPAPGEKLFLRSEAPSQPKLISLNTEDETEEEVAITEADDKSLLASVEPVQRHTVQTRETLFSLAKRYQVTQDQIKEWNKLNTGDLKVGQEILIYKSR